jgi:abortive infection bacteriophage resistance protein
MTAEIMTFGILLTMFRGVGSPIKKQIAGEYGVSDTVLESWLRALNGVRNICAHHGRLWNRELGYRPAIPRNNKHPEWHIPVEVLNNRTFGILTILKYLIKMIAPQSKWSERFDHLLVEYPEIPLLPMGFPADWRECSIWNG